MRKTLTLSLKDWRTLLDFAGKVAREIAEYDDEHEDYINVRTVLNKIEGELHEPGNADVPLFVPASAPSDSAS